MDIKITLSFEETIALKAKEFAASKGMSLSRMVEHIFEHLTVQPKYFNNLDEIPFASYINNMVADEPATYVMASSKKRKAEYYASKK